MIKNKYIKAMDDMSYEYTLSRELIGKGMYSAGADALETEIRKLKAKAEALTRLKNQIIEEEIPE